MKSPYTHMNGRAVERIDQILLDGLSHCKAPASTDAVIQISDPRGFAQLDTEQVIHQLTLMIAEGYVERAEGQGFHDRIRWQITEKGRAHLIATETCGVIDDVARHTPVRTARTTEKPRIEEVAEIDVHAQLRAAHKQLDRDGVPPAASRPSVATVCLEDAELDDWWSSLNVQAKAEIFCDHSLINADTHAEAADLQIPITGTLSSLSSESLSAIDPLSAVTGGD